MAMDGGYHRKQNDLLVAELQKRGLPTDGNCKDIHIVRLWRDDRGLTPLVWDRRYSKTSYSHDSVQDLADLVNMTRPGPGIRVNGDKDTIVADLVTDYHKLFTKKNHQPAQRSRFAEPEVEASSMVKKQTKSTSLTTAGTDSSHYINLELDSHVAPYIKAEPTSPRPSASSPQEILAATPSADFTSRAPCNSDSSSLSLGIKKTIARSKPLSSLKRRLAEVKEEDKLDTESKRQRTAENVIEISSFSMISE